MNDEKIAFVNELIRMLLADPELRSMVIHALKHTLMPWKDRGSYAVRENLIGDDEVRCSAATPLRKASTDDHARGLGYKLVN